MTKKTQWQLDHEEKVKLRNKAMKSLTEAQREAVEETHKILCDVLQTIHDMDDLCLSDIRNLSTVMWNLKHEFNLRLRDD